MRGPQGGEEKLGSQILRLIDTWVNIISQKKKKKKINAGYFYHVPGTDRREIKDTVPGLIESDPQE